MKPLLIIPPAPARWDSLAGGFDSLAGSRLTDLRARFTHEIRGADDVLAIVPDGSIVIAAACIRRTGPIGVLGELFTQPSHRLRGHARRLLQTLLSWFDMTGGRWLYAAAGADVAERFLENFGFATLSRLGAGAGETRSLCRALGTQHGGPLDGLNGELKLRPTTRADFATLYALAQHAPGPDPRVPIEESAATAEAFILDLLDQQERGECHIVAGERGSRIVGFASLATKQSGKRTYAMITPFGVAPSELRTAILGIAAERGYESVDFPLELMAPPAPQPAQPAVPTVPVVADVAAESVAADPSR